MHPETHESGLPRAQEARSVEWEGRKVSQVGILERRIFRENIDLWYFPALPFGVPGLLDMMKARFVRFRMRRYGLKKQIIKKY